MTQFSAVLRAAFTETGMTQEELAARMEGGSQGSLSRLLNTESLPRPAMLEQICAQFPPHIRAGLVAAYLADQIPASAANLISVGIVREGDDDLPVKYRINRAAPDSALRKNLDIIEQHGLFDVDVASMVEHLASILDRAKARLSEQTESRAYSIREDPHFLAVKKDMSAAEATTKKRRGKRS